MGAALCLGTPEASSLFLRFPLEGSTTSVFFDVADPPITYRETLTSYMERI